MTAPLPCARRYSNHMHQPQPTGRIILDYDGRFVRRKVVHLEDGQPILIDLMQTTSLDHGGALILESGAEIEVVAAAEPLLEVTADDLTRVAWHIGNRHTPCQIESGRLLIQRDHVIADMLSRIGARTRDVVEPFTPEGGAYGHGRTQSHDHGHTHHRGHDHGPDHGDGHGH
jgi:urease accessory protein